MVTRSAFLPVLILINKGGFNVYPIAISEPYCRANNIPCTIIGHCRPKNLCGMRFDDVVAIRKNS